MHLRKRECSESCAEPSAILAHSSYTALYMSICQVQSLHKCQVPIQIITNTKYHASGVSAHTLSRVTGAAHALRACRVCRRLLEEVKIPLDLPPCEVRRGGEEGASEDAGDS